MCITPIETNARVCEWLGCEIRIKRDDLYPMVGGGNKARKARRIVDRAIMDGYDAVVTNGGLQSNHARATALCCAESGIPCFLVLHTLAPHQTPVPSGNLQLCHLAGADIRYCSLEKLSDTMGQTVASLRSKGMNPLYVWGGGHCTEGAHAYYDAALEARRQLQSWVPDVVLHASGTGTTQAGLAAGFGDSNTTVIGISVAREAERGARVVREALDDLGQHLALQVSDLKVDFRDTWTGGGYEAESQALWQIIRQAGQMGLILDPTYTGKAWQALCKLLQEGDIRKSSRILFWHTGGLPNLMATRRLGTG